MFYTYKLTTQNEILENKYNAQLQVANTAPVSPLFFPLKEKKGGETNSERYCCSSSQFQ